MEVPPPRIIAWLHVYTQNPAIWSAGLLIISVQTVRIVYTAYGQVFRENDLKISTEGCEKYSCSKSCRKPFGKKMKTYIIIHHKEHAV